MPALKGNWENAFSGKQLDSVHEETLAVSATGVIVDKKHIRPLLLQRRRHRLTEENPRKVLAPGKKVLLEGKVKKRANISSKESVRIRRVIIGILPYVKIANLYQDANSATNVCLDTLRLMGSPEKSRRKVVERISCLTEGVYTIWLHHIKIRERMGPRQGIVRKCEPQEHNPCAPKFQDRTLQENLQQERCAQREAWDLATNVYQLKAKHKDTFYSPTEAWVRRAPSSKKPEKRDFVVDSRASMHMLRREDLNSAELETPRKFRNPTTVNTANEKCKQMRRHKKTFTILIFS